MNNKTNAEPIGTTGQMKNDHIGDVNEMIEDVRGTNREREDFEAWVAEGNLDRHSLVTAAQRDDVLRLASEAGFTAGGIKVYEDCFIKFAALLQGQQAAPQDGWISVSESLPEEHQSVLAYRAGRRGIGSWHGTVDGKPWTWTFNNTASGESMKFEYWMPLPKAPEGKP